MIKRKDRWLVNGANWWSWCTETTFSHSYTQFTIPLFFWCCCTPILNAKFCAHRGLREQTSGTSLSTCDPDWDRRAIRFLGSVQVCDRLTNEYEYATAQRTNNYFLLRPNDRRTISYYTTTTCFVHKAERLLHAPPRLLSNSWNYTAYSFLQQLSSTISSKVNRVACLLQLVIAHPMPPAKDHLGLHSEPHVVHILLWVVV